MTVLLHSWLFRLIQTCGHETSRQCSPSPSPKPAAPAASENCVRNANSQAPSHIWIGNSGNGIQQFVANKLSRWLWYTLMCENHNPPGGPQHIEITWGALQSCMPEDTDLIVPKEQFPGTLPRKHFKQTHLRPTGLDLYSHRSLYTSFLMRVYISSVHIYTHTHGNTKQPAPGMMDLCWDGLQSACQGLGTRWSSPLYRLWHLPLCDGQHLLHFLITRFSHQQYSHQNTCCTITVYQSFLNFFKNYFWFHF